MRYLPHSDADVRRMLDVIGVKDIDDLFASIPQSHRIDGEIDLPAPMSEPALRRHLAELGGQPAPQAMIGAGAYQHAAPILVDQLLLRTEFYSAYTPYQPEISQGTLQGIFEYQSMIASLCGLDVANASTYDGASSCAEAVLMAHRQLRKKRHKILVSAGLHPEYLQVLSAYLAAAGLEIQEIPLSPEGRTDLEQTQNLLDDDCIGLLLQSPNFFGLIEDIESFAGPVHEAGALLIAAVPEPVALGIMRAPGDAGADIVFGEGLALTGALNYGGPGFGFFASRRSYMRQIPGRLVGATVDKRGERGFVLTLATREQHIRRERATSNICTNQGLMALAGAMTLSLWGPQGLRELATNNVAKAQYAKKRAQAQGLKLVYDGPSFNEFVLDIGRVAGSRLATLESRGIVGGLDLERFDPKRAGQVLVCTTEVHPKALIDEVIDVLAGKEQAS